MERTEEVNKIAYDVKLKRPGCAIIQAGYGCDPQVVAGFDSRLWLVAPTPDMKVYPLTDDAQLRQLIALTEEANK